MEPADVERELRGLAERIRAIEDRLGVPAASAVVTPEAVSSAPNWNWQPLGIGLVSLGAAYVLRAMTESGTIPAGAGVAIGVAYAAGWLAWSAKRGEPLYAATSALVLGPLIWEAVARFHVLGAWGAGILLFGFALMGHLLSGAVVSTLTALATACALLISTRDVVPFTTLFLLIAAAIEGSACLGRWLAERWPAAATADAAVLFATWLATNPHGLPEGYAPISHGWMVGAQVALLGIFLTSTIIRTLVRHYTVTAFEMTQCAAALAIVIWGGLAAAPVLLAAGAGCYVVSFVVLERGGGRNFYAYSTFALLLILAGSRSSLVWLAAAVVCSWSKRVTLQVHGVVYLGLALTTSAPWAGAVATGLCYAGAAQGPVRIPMFAATVWSAAVLVSSVAPESLRLAARLLVAGAGLILLPRAIASRGGGSAGSGTTPRLRDSEAKSGIASAAG